MKDDKTSKTFLFNGWILRVFLVFVLLFIVSFSFPHYALLNFGSWLSPFFETLAEWSAQQIFHLQQPYTTSLISDSTGFYINAFNILVLALLIGTTWHFLDKKQQYNPQLQYFLFVVMRYYLAMQMLAYGWSKVFKWQFYLPEPNLLFTPLGQLSHDILYWSTMGTSRGYVVFIGTIEVVVALLLFFRKTRLIAALVGIGVMSNIVAVNLGFNISVKLYSSFLLLLFVILTVPDFKRLWLFFIKNQTASPRFLWFPDFKDRRLIRFYRIMKTLVIGMILIDSLSMYIEANNFNDDTTSRPDFHGAYQVETIIHNNDTIPLLLENAHQWQRIFIHRKDYFISQDRNDRFQDYQMEKINEGEYEITHTLTKAKAQLNIRRQNDMVKFHIVSESDTVEYSTSLIDLQTLPLMQRNFHWRIDQY